MSCWDSSILRAYIDRELEPDTVAEIEKHLAECPECAHRYETLINNDRFINTVFTEHLDEIHMAEGNKNEAWNKLNARIKIQNKRRLFELSTKYRRIAVAAVVAVCLVGSMSFAGVRGAVGEFLSVFRVEKIQTISITPQEMAQIQSAVEKGVGRIDIDKFGSLEVFGKDEAVNDITLAEAEKQVDFKLLAPQGEDYAAPKVNVQKYARKDFTLNVGYVNELITKLGGEKLLPAEIDGKTFSISMSPSVDLTYSTDKGMPLFSLMEMKSPEMAVPGGIEVEPVKDALLGLPFWPEEIKQQLSGINDWEHTMVLPDDGKGSRVTVRGCQGMFFSNQAGQTQLIWLEDGVVYCLAGQLSQDKALEIAESMKQL